VEEFAIDLVVMGTHGRGLVGRALLGGVTAKVVRLSPRPVLAVRWSGAQIRTPWGKVLVAPRPPDAGPRFAHLLVPLDGSALAEAILPVVRSLARTFGSALTLVQVVEPVAYPMIDATGVEARMREEAGRYLDGVKETMRADGFRVQSEVLFGAPTRAILEYAARVGADGIAMATHGRGGLDRWLLGSVAEKVLSASEVPVLLQRAWSVPS
jgi:nucleotide-binding universal stress UspA family protein